MTICIGITTNQFVNPIAIGKLGWKLVRPHLPRHQSNTNAPLSLSLAPQYIVYCAFLLFQLGYIYLFLVETKGKTLEETAAIFDGQKETDNLHNVGYQAVTESRHGYGFNSSKTAAEAEDGGGAEDIQLSLSRHNSMAPTIATERENDEWRERMTSAESNYSSQKDLKRSRDSPI